MSELEEKLFSRLSAKFYTLFPQKWVLHPPEAGKVLQHLNPLHGIVISDKHVGVDGLFIKSNQSPHDKSVAILAALEQMYGEVEREVKISALCTLKVCPTGIYLLTTYDNNYPNLILPSILQVPVVDSALYFNNLFQVNMLRSPPDKPIPLSSLDLITSRFAYEVQLDEQFNANTFKSFISDDKPLEDCLVGAAMCDGESKVLINISKKFFEDPTPENVTVFGDLCFLSQMTVKWTVPQRVPLFMRLTSKAISEAPYGFPTPEYLVADAISRTVGAKSFLSYGLIQKLICDGSEEDVEENDQSWRRLLTYLERTLRWKNE